MHFAFKQKEEKTNLKSNVKKGKLYKEAYFTPAQILNRSILQQMVLMKMIQEAKVEKLKGTELQMINSVLCRLSLKSH